MGDRTAEPLRVCRTSAEPWNIKGSAHLSRFVDCFCDTLPNVAEPFWHTQDSGAHKNTAATLVFFPRI
jgi:hypothetical protein